MECIKNFISSGLEVPIEDACTDCIEDIYGESLDSIKDKQIEPFELLSFGLTFPGDYVLEPGVDGIVSRVDDYSEEQRIIVQPKKGAVRVIMDIWMSAEDAQILRDIEEHEVSIFIPGVEGDFYPEAIYLSE